MTPLFRTIGKTVQWNQTRYIPKWSPMRTFTGRRQYSNGGGEGNKQQETQSGWTGGGGAGKGEDDNKTLALKIVATMVAVLGASYAAVPLYRVFCEATGYGGAVKDRKTVADLTERRRDGIERDIRVFFSAERSSTMQWSFLPQQRQVVVTPGESALVFYTAKNPTEEPIIGVSTYNVTPAKAAPYFNKIQCFCFEEQRLEPGEEIDLPVFFYIDPAYVDDPSLRNTNDITLSYTFYKSKQQ
ncbi:hypothetical protein PROFUN_13542 [Planoprotostelium fungivorum]|uniref:Cytochrome c oxidase assembly protein COX11, mitochondrial n=1 Tax=Planoprotostelium fungivorum TaxID=1890364 RepID=A0A2P6N3T0_9EUKA|nr:hypothetical protein PROFUN_13542 [Planoprotostelium fungivorum]